MKNLLISALFCITSTLSITANAGEVAGLQHSNGTLIWHATNGWMQVQNAATFQTVPGCEGFITSCATGAGTYIVINHSTGDRSTIEAENQQLTVPTPPTPVPVVVPSTPTFTIITNQVRDVANAIAFCPTGTTGIAGNCYGLYNATRTPMLWSMSRTNATSHFCNSDAAGSITVQVTCVSQ